MPILINNRRIIIIIIIVIGIIIIGINPRFFLFAQYHDAIIFIVFVLVYVFF